MKKQKALIIIVSEFLIFPLLILILGTYGHGKSSKKIVLVPPFENLSEMKSVNSYEVATNKDPNNPKRAFTVDRYSEIPRAILEDIFVNLGVEVVERQRLDQMLLESEFIRLSGLVDTDNAIKLGKLLGANFICMGTIIDIHPVETNFSGYGINVENTIVKCSIRIRLINIESGKNEFSKIVKGERIFRKTEYGGVIDKDVASSVIQDTLPDLLEDDDFLKFFKEDKGVK